MRNYGAGDYCEFVVAITVFDLVWCPVHYRHIDRVLAIHSVQDALYLVPCVGSLCFLACILLLIRQAQTELN